MLSGTAFALDIASKTSSETTRAGMRQGLSSLVNGPAAGPVLRWREGDTVTLHVRNRLRGGTIHWHGILLPVRHGPERARRSSFAGHPAGARPSLSTAFRCARAAPSWYHSHSGFQEQTGLYGALVIDPPAPNCIRRRPRLHGAAVSDWTDEDPMRVFHKLKAMPDYYSRNQPSLQTLGAAGGPGRLDAGVARPADVAGHGDAAHRPGRCIRRHVYYTWSTARRPRATGRALFRPGRSACGCASSTAPRMTYFDVRIPGLKLTVVSADGQAVRPVEVDEFRIGVAETYDIVVEPRRGPRLHPVRAIHGPIRLRARHAGAARRHAGRGAAHGSGAAADHERTWECARHESA